MSGTAQHNKSLPDFLYTGLLSKNVLGLTELPKQSSLFFYCICYLEQIDHLQESVFLSKDEGNNIINISFSKERIIHLFKFMYKEKYYFIVLKY